MKIHYYGHSCFLVEAGGKKLLFDPFIRPNPLAAEINVQEIKPDYILISHGHEDHMADAIYFATHTSAKIIAAYEITVWLAKNGAKNSHAMNIGGSFNFDFGKVKCVNAIHSSSLPDGTYGGNPMGFIIETGEFNFYYAGDTALTNDMKLIGAFKTLDFAFLPVGDNFTMGIDNAIIASDFIKCNNIIGMHFDTFEAIKINKELAISKFEKAGKALVLMEPGKIVEL